MPRSKEEIFHHVNQMVQQIVSGKRDPYAPQFAELFIVGDTKPQPIGETIEPQDPQELQCRRLFAEMRQMGSKLGQGTDARLQETLFYMQARFMEDFTDDYGDHVPFSMYFPGYQVMSHEQLRTYFTWRTKVRAGQVQETSLSYVFLYTYELINNIGTADKQDGLEKLLFLWEQYKPYTQKLNRYMREWLKEFYIVKGFDVAPEALQEQFPQLASCFPKENPRSLFAVYAPLSHYKYEKSNFFTPEFAVTLDACFSHVVKALDTYMQQEGSAFADLLFYGKGGCPWQPFRRALYCPTCDSPDRDRTVTFSQSEIYWIENGRWYCSNGRSHRESGRHLVGYMIRRVEQFYRSATKFRSKITANTEKLDVEGIAQLAGSVEGFFACIDNAIAEFYRLSKRIIVTVDTAALAQIRQNASITQQKLMVSPLVEALPVVKPIMPPLPAVPKAGSDPWQLLAQSLNAVERQAVALMLQNKPLAQLQACAKAGGQMLEVLIDTINEKALGAVNDNICNLEDTAVIFEEYRHELERVINCACK